MSKRKITDFFSQNKITKTSEPQDFHHDTIDTDLDELLTPTSTKKGGVFIKTPLNNFKKALGKDGKLNKHNDSASHIRSIEQERLTLVFSKNPVYCQILNQSSEECKINRKHFSLLFRSIYFLAKEEIAHTTKYEPLIKRLIMKSSESFENWIVTNSDRSTYISKATTSELLCCASEILCKKLNDEVFGKKFSLMADESTNEAANMSGNKIGVRRLISEKAGREVPYIHCRVHLLSLALTSMRNKFPKIKRIFHVLKDIYKLFQQSPKREEMLHRVQTIINDPILKVPEAIEIQQVIKEMDRRFNDTAAKLIEGCSIFENYSMLSDASEKLIEQLCDCLSISEYDKKCIILDFKSFKFVALNKKEIGGNPISDLLEVNMGYQNLRKLAESVLCIPIATATVERSFSAMN
ncbi:zinc finger protein 862-like [Aphis craccivora]|uniref:Zinc finger protein 862-like n=1 Tax=Aphis craccivora TaxID=307492 RepID=A0A6G0YC94_APHCR|nr:zinc finger protein 862-like [Aphis craccivora]